MVDSKQIQLTDFQELASEFNVPVRALRAVAHVESEGSGFLANGQVKILFERHIFWKRLQTPDRQIAPQRIALTYPELCGPDWNPGRYPYGTEMDQWAKLVKIETWAERNASAQAESYKKAAYEACSWGMLQLLGQNYGEAGYSDITALAGDFFLSERNQLHGTLRWMKSENILQPLAEEDWKEFAARYNGKGQVVAYAKRLADAYRDLG